MQMLSLLTEEHPQFPSYLVRFWTPEIQLKSLFYSLGTQICFWVGGKNVLLPVGELILPLLITKLFYVHC